MQNDVERQNEETLHLGTYTPTIQKVKFKT